MDASSSRALVLSLAILVSVATGVLIGSALARSDSRPAEVMSPATPNPELVTALRSLQDELAAARRDREGLTAMSSAPHRTEAGTPPVDANSGEIREATKQLVQAIDAIRQLSNTVRGERAPLVVPPFPRELAVLETFTSKDIASQKKPYLLNSYQELMDRFGRPSEVLHSDGGLITWMYRAQSGVLTWFTFSDGLVVNVRCEEPSR